jgi:hypothetical protein
MRILANETPSARFLELGSGQRLKIVCVGGASFLQSLDDEGFDFIFADTCSGKNRFLCSDADRRFHVAKMSWGSGIILATAHDGTGDKNESGHHAR